MLNVYGRSLGSVWWAACGLVYVVFLVRVAVGVWPGLADTARFWAGGALPVRSSSVNPFQEPFMLAVAGVAGALTAWALLRRAWHAAVVAGMLIAGALDLFFRRGASGGATGYYLVWLLLIGVSTYFAARARARSEATG